MWDFCEFYPMVMSEFTRGFSAAARSEDPEQALSVIATAAIEALGDKDASRRPGALKPGEVLHTIAGYFFVREGVEDMLLLAEIGWPPEQHRLRIAIDEGRPGWVVENAAPLVNPNTDEDKVFTQIISSARMGSSMYAPLVSNGDVLGLITVACQARYTYDSSDLELLVIAARHAAAVWIALDGPTYLARQRPVLPRHRP